jgi:hypothetical protein
MVRVVGDEMEEHLAALHYAVNEFERHGFREARLALRLRPIDDPVIQLLLGGSKRGELRMHGNVTRPETVLAPFKMGLPDQIDDIDVVECANNGLEQRLALLLGFTRRERGNALEHHLVRPGFVLGKHSSRLCVHHRVAPSM